MGNYHGASLQHNTYYIVSFILYIFKSLIMSIAMSFYVKKLNEPSQKCDSSKNNICTY